MPASDSAAAEDADDADVPKRRDSDEDAGEADETRMGSGRRRNGGSMLLSAEDEDGDVDDADGRI